MHINLWTLFFGGTGLVIISMKVALSAGMSVAAQTFILVPAFSVSFACLTYFEPIGSAKIIAVILTVTGIGINTISNFKINSIFDKCGHLSKKVILRRQLHLCIFET
jgi:hypothetical protein